LYPTNALKRKRLSSLPEATAAFLLSELAVYALHHVRYWPWFALLSLLTFWGWPLVRAGLVLMGGLRVWAVGGGKGR
jgi:hypothetical protein